MQVGAECSSHFRLRVIVVRLSWNGALISFIAFVLLLDYITPRFQIKDDRGELMNDPHAKPEDRGRRPVGSRRTLRVRLDPAQYHADTLLQQQQAAAAGARGVKGGAEAEEEGVDVYR